MIDANEKVVNVQWTPALEDAPVGRLLHLAEDENVPLAVRLAINRELVWRAEELASYTPQTLEVLLRMQKMEGGCHGEKA
jgi:hypothetical protein